ncbi:chromosomal replication initiator protein DnaA [Vitreoscilla stercoraria]|uniref:Chromosomal replication initiator protein DnaA n=2 Tax=Vitreoscilla stercoraria TaxID=61 RepID=A0ABY4EBW9_VITST|nr:MULTISPECIES: chromosomal replication initiator protein DnaA [Vitreoscilla]UOO92915.1 chromosomal replication initiator protein DnaA [Vitreoscilla stercoraria]
MAVWPHALLALRDTLSSQQYQMWIAPLTIGNENNTWTVYAKNNFVFGFVKSHFWQHIEASVAALTQDSPGLQLKIGQGESVAIASAPLMTTAPIATPQPQKTSPKTPAKVNAKAATDDLFADDLLPDDVIDGPMPTPAPTSGRGMSAKDIIQRNLERPRKPRANEVSGSTSLSNAGIILPTQAPIVTPSAPSIIKSASDHMPAIGSHAEQTRLNSSYTFETLVQGKGNRMAYAGAQTIAENPGSSMYNPYFIYGSTGYGKTHLIQAIGNRIYQRNPRAKIRYIHAETYVRDIMKAFRSSSFDEFKKHYHSLDLLLIDDVQFISGKDRTMEEFFYLFNHLLDGKKQVVMTCDTLPANIKNMDDRLKSRFSWGLTVELEPPELEMRVAILQKKAEMANVQMQEKAAFFIAQHIRSNVRELEGAFKRVAAHSLFQHKPIDIALATEALQDILVEAQRQLTVEHIMKTVADFYQLKIADLVGKKRSRPIARPRQMAMALAKDLTQQSLPSIGNVFGGRDHTTVMHAHKTIHDLKHGDAKLAQDYDYLSAMLQK